MSCLIGCHSSFACSSARSLRSVSQDAFESKFFNGKNGKNKKKSKKSRRFNSSNKHFDKKNQKEMRRGKILEGKQNTTNAEHLLEDLKNVEIDFFKEQNKEDFIEAICNDCGLGSNDALEKCLSENRFACPCSIFPYPKCPWLNKSELCPCGRSCFALGRPCYIERTRLCFNCRHELTMATMHPFQKQRPKCNKKEKDDDEPCITCNCLMKPCCGKSRIPSYPNPAPFPLTKSETRCRVFEEIEFDRHMYRQCFGEDFC
jgi:hypothetical protein